MGVYNSELFTNLGLCCFYAQQYDMTLNCFERALALASDENMADVWYNIGHVALVCSPFLVYCVCSVKDLSVIPNRRSSVACVQIVLSAGPRWIPAS